MQNSKIKMQNCNSKLKIIFSAVFFMTFFAVSTTSAQTVTGVSGSFIHGQNITISGSGFGIKNPAAPLWWDDGEGAAVNNPSIMTSGDILGVISSLGSGNKHYSEAVPNAAINTVTPKTDAYMQYRTTSFRSVAGPHSRSTKYMTGSHYQYCIASGDEEGCTGDNVPYGYTAESHYENVALTVDTAIANKDIWFVHYYHRLDPSWSTTLLDLLNHKWNVFQIGAQAYTGTNIYQSFDRGYSPDNTVGSDVRTSGGNNIACGNANPWMPGNGNPRLGWLKYEVRTKIGEGALRKVSVDNILVYDDAEWGGCPASWTVLTRSFTVGGYYRRGTGANVNENYRGDRNNYRYFDDIYMDNTFSRVVLANSQNYGSATIVEPQIPSVWSDGSVTAKVNLGKLPDSGTAYLFVFDANNNHNAVGYPVTLGGSTPPPDTTPPAAPTGVVVS